MKDLLNKFRAYEYLEPWYSIKDENGTFITELKKELHGEHFLYGKDVVVLAKREDYDDIVVSFFEEKPKFAVVHLTWKQAAESKPYPQCKLYNDWAEFRERMLNDHKNQE